MEGSTKKSIEEHRHTQEKDGKVDIELLEHLRDKIEYLQVKGDFFDDQTEVWSKLIYNQKLKDKEFLKEEQELVDMINEREIEKNKLASHLKSLKDELKVKKSNENVVKKTQKALVKINGFYYCPECPYKANHKCMLNRHVNAVHRKLKPWKCSECDKGKFTYFIFLIQLLIVHLFQRFLTNEY